MKYLVVGASGMVGHLIGIYLEEAGHDVVGYSRRTSPLSSHVQGDLYDLELLDKTIAGGHFDAVVNAAGLLVKDCEEHPDRAAFINGFIPHYLAKTVDESKTKVIQLSTDCIFRGNTGPYAENSTPDGNEFYSLTKHTGEITYGRHLTLRNSVVGPDISIGGIGLLNWFMKQSGTIDGWDRAIWTGLTTLELAKVIEYAVEHDASGLVNMVPEGSGISKYDLLQLFNKYFRHGTADIIHTDYFVSDKTLVRTNFDMNYRVPTYEDMVKELAAWVRDHEDLYPDYYIQ